MRMIINNFQIFLCFSFKILYYLIFQNKIGTNVAPIKDRNNNDEDKNVGTTSIGITIPKIIDFVKSGLGKKRTPTANPNNIDFNIFFLL